MSKQKKKLKKNQIQVDSKIYDVNSPSYAQMYEDKFEGGDVVWDNLKEEFVSVPRGMNDAWNEFYKKQRVGKVQDKVRKGTGKFVKGATQGVGTALAYTGEVMNTPLALMGEALSGRNDYYSALPNLTRAMKDMGLEGQLTSEDKKWLPNNDQMTPGALVSDNPLIQMGIDVPLDILTGKAFTKTSKYAKQLNKLQDVFKSSKKAISTNTKKNASLVTKEVLPTETIKDVENVATSYNDSKLQKNYFKAYDESIIAKELELKKIQKELEDLKNTYRLEFEKTWGKNYDEKDLLSYAQIQEGINPSKKLILPKEFLEVNEQFTKDFDVRDIENISEMSALSDYTSGRYLGFNQLLGGQHNLPFYKEFMMPLLDDAITKNTLSKDLKLHRGFGNSKVKVLRNNNIVDEVPVKDLLPGDKFLDPKYQSTSLFEVPHFSEQKTILAPKGTNFGYANKQGLSYVPSELELTLPKNTIYEVTDPNTFKIIKSFKNGGMIKRADGSYSQRGLWDNIRANKGSGKKPTKEMLAQEKKIKKKMELGGLITNDMNNKIPKMNWGGKLAPMLFDVGANALVNLTSYAVTDMIKAIREPEQEMRPTKPNTGFTMATGGMVGGDPTKPTFSWRTGYPTQQITMAGGYNTPSTYLPSKTSAAGKVWSDLMKAQQIHEGNQFPDVEVKASDFDEKYQEAKKTGKKYNDKSNLKRVQDVENFLGDVATETALDQIPYLNIPKAIYSMKKGRPLTAATEFIKTYSDPRADALINSLQNNPSGYDVAHIEDNYIPELQLKKRRLTDIGKERIKNKLLPTVNKAHEQFGVSKKEFVDFINQNMDLGRSYEQALGDFKKQLDYQKGLQDELNNFAAGDEYGTGGTIHIKPSKRGTFTAAAKKHGKSVQAFASQVLANKDNYSSAMVKKANFAKNAAGWKHAFGGIIDPSMYMQQMMYGSYAQGGQVPQNIPVEVEGGEAYELPNGEMGEFEGPSHDNGGIPVALPEQTKVYSKQLKVNGKTMADRKTKREANVAKLEKILSKNPSDKFIKEALKRQQETAALEEQSDMAMQEQANQKQQMQQQAQQGMMQEQAMAGLMQDPAMMQQMGMMMYGGKLANGTPPYGLLNYISPTLANAVNKQQYNKLIPTENLYGKDFQVMEDLEYDEQGNPMTVVYDDNMPKTKSVNTLNSKTKVANITPPYLTEEQLNQFTNFNTNPLDLRKNVGVDVTKPEPPGVNPYDAMNNIMGNTFENIALSKDPYINTKGGMIPNPLYNEVIGNKMLPEEDPKKPNKFMNFLNKAVDQTGDFFSGLFDKDGKPKKDKGTKSDEGLDYTRGDLMGMAGTLFGGLAPMTTTMLNRMMTPKNQNFFREFGAEGLRAMQEAQALSGINRDKQLADIKLGEEASRQRGRNSARGVNTLRAMDIAADMGANQAQNQAYNAYAQQMMQLLGQKAQMENQQDQAVMTGEYQRDLADRQDVDNFYSNLSENFASQSELMQKQGRDMNQAQYNKMILEMSPMFSKYGIGVEMKNGKYVMTHNGEDIDQTTARLIVEKGIEAEKKAALEKAGTTTAPVTPNATVNPVAPVNSNIIPAINPLGLGNTPYFNPIFKDINIPTVTDKSFIKAATKRR